MILHSFWALESQKWLVWVVQHSHGCWWASVLLWVRKLWCLTTWTSPRGCLQEGGVLSLEWDARKWESGREIKREREREEQEIAWTQYRNYNLFITLSQRWHRPFCIIPSATWVNPGTMYEGCEYQKVGIVKGWFWTLATTLRIAKESLIDYWCILRGECGANVYTKWSLGRERKSDSMEVGTELAGILSCCPLYDLEIIHAA